MTQTKQIPMPAFGKARPRVTRNGTFMPADYERQKKQLAMMFGPVEVEGMVKLLVTAVRRLPKRTKHRVGDYCTAGPDSDNILGSIMDALFSDDSCVVDGRCIRLWGEEDMLIIELGEVENRPSFAAADQIIEERRDLWERMANE